MATEDDMSDTFLTGIKLALLRHCIMTRSEDKLFFEMVNGLSNILQNKTKNPQTVVVEFCKNVIKSLDVTTKEKLDRLLAFVDNMNKLDQGKQEEQRQIGNLQERWNNTVSQFNNFDINMGNIQDAQQKAIDLINNTNPVFNEAFEIHEEITKLGNDLSSHAGNQIKLILKASHLNQEGLSKVLIENPCENIGK